MIFDDSIYYANHGGKPRGEGSWAFISEKHLPIYRRGLSDYLDYVLWGHGKYSDAKKIVMKQVAALRRSGSTLADDFRKTRRMYALP